jgi:hypothetical protein
LASALHSKKLLHLFFSMTLECYSIKIWTCWL